VLLLLSRHCCIAGRWPDLLHSPSRIFHVVRAVRWLLPPHCQAQALLRNARAHLRQHSQQVP